MNNDNKEKTDLLEIGLEGAKPTEDKRSESEEDGMPANAGCLNDSEVTEKGSKRKFAVEYKARIVREADACTEAGQIGALLRREGLYSSQLAQWRRAYQKGALAALRDDKRGRKQIRHPLEVENEKLKQANARLEKRLEQAEAIIDIQKKLSGLMGIPLQSKRSEEKD